MAKFHFIPTLKMASSSRLGLRLRQKFERGSTQVGAGKAGQLAERGDLTELDVNSARSFVARQVADQEAKAHQENSDGDPSSGFIAWLLWGEDAGRAWAERKSRQLDNQHET